MPDTIIHRSAPARTATRFWASTNLSIHPRNWPDSVLDALKWRERRKLNTSAKRSPKRIQRAIAGIERHIKAHPNDAQSKVRLLRLLAAA